MRMFIMSKIKGCHGIIDIRFRTIFDSYFEIGPKLAHHSRAVQIYPNGKLPTSSRGGQKWELWYFLTFVRDSR